MADKYQKLKQVKFDDCGETSYSIRVVKNSDYNKYYVSLTRNAVYIDKVGISKLGDQTLYLTLLSVSTLIKNLDPALCFAEKCDAQEKSAHILKLLITQSSITEYNDIILCAIEEEAEALATNSAEEDAAKPPAEGREQQQKEYEQKVKEQWKIEDATDGKFEDFVAAGVRTAELVAA